MNNKLRLLTPGPTPLPENVRLALARDMIHHRKQDFEAIMQRTQEKCRLLFGTTEPVLPLACSGTGAMTAAVLSLFNPGEKVLIVEGGKFGERWTEIAQTRNLETIRLEIPWGNAVHPADIEAILRGDPQIRGILVQLCETSTGVMNPIAEIGKIAKDALLIVDGISGVGISPCPMDAWKIDCLLTGSQKGLMVPPGLALIALSKRAWAKAETIRSGCFYFNLPAERKKLAKNQTNFTTPVNLVAGLDASLAMIFANGLDAIYKKQWALTQMVHAGLEALGLPLLAPQNYAWGLTAFRTPPDVDSGKILKILEKDFGIVMAGGQDRLKGKIIRFGHMGWVDWGDCLAGLAALAIALAPYGIDAGDYAGAAMHSYQESLENWQKKESALC